MAADPKFDPVPFVEDVDSEVEPRDHPAPFTEDVDSEVPRREHAMPFVPDEEKSAKDEKPQPQASSKSGKSKAGS
jgi:hypothetical protein